MARVSSITSFYPNVEFKSWEYLGNGPYNKRYQICDCCGQYKKVYVLNKPVYYKKGIRRKFVSYCSDCDTNLNKCGRVVISDHKDFGYYEILDAIKNSSSNNTTAKPISFEEAVKIAYNRTQDISYNGFGAEPGVSMLKRYMGGRHVKDNNNNLSLDDKRLWEFRYKLQYEEPRVKVVEGSYDSKSDGDNNSNNNNNTLLLTWNKEYVEESSSIDSKLV
jgi:hypothetical protein